MAEKFDVVALGELLIDFTKNGVSNQGNGLFEACPRRRALQCAGHAAKAE